MSTSSCFPGSSGGSVTQNLPNSNSFPISTYKAFKRFTISPDFLSAIPGVTAGYRLYYAEVQRLISITKQGYAEIER
ncbi:MAG: hypothetical protein AB1489_42285, partial [Acidobacteriota bacterium]